MNILITSAGQRVSLIRAFQSELTKFYSHGKVFATDMNPELSPACQVADMFLKVKRVTHSAYISELLEVALQHNIRMIVPTIDTELQVLADNRSLFEAYGIHVIVPSSHFVQKCRDKRKINLFFQARGIDIPLPIDKKNPSFPLFIKPYDGSLSSDTFLIRKQEELTAYHLTNRKLLFMEYINREIYDEYTVDMYYGRDNHLKCIVPRKRITVRAGEVNKGKTSYNEIVPFLKGKMDYIDGVIGCLTTQVFYNESNEHIIGIEINPRFGGGFPLSYNAGANYPEYLIREHLLGEKITYTDAWENNLLMLRYDAEVLVHDTSVSQLAVHRNYGLIKHAS